MIRLFSWSVTFRSSFLKPGNSALTVSLSLSSSTSTAGVQPVKRSLKGKSGCSNISSIWLRKRASGESNLGRLIKRIKNSFLSPLTISDGSPGDSRAISRNLLGKPSQETESGDRTGAYFESGSGVDPIAKNPVQGEISVLLTPCGNS